MSKSTPQVLDPLPLCHEFPFFILRDIELVERSLRAIPFEKVGDLDAISFSDYFAVIFHYSFFKADSMLYYLLTHNNPPPLIGSFYWTALSDGGHLSVTRTQFL